MLSFVFSAALELAPHPRLRLLDGDLPGLQTVLDHDETAKDYFDALLAYNDNLLTAPLVNCSLSGVENSLLAQARSVLDRTYSLGLAYRIGERANINASAYAKRAIQEMLHVVSDDCPSWNPAHFLDTAEMTHAVAIGYDWLFSVLTPDERNKIEAGVLSKGLLAGLTAYTAPKPAWWSNSTSSHTKLAA